MRNVFFVRSLPWRPCCLLRFKWLDWMLALIEMLRCNTTDKYVLRTKKTRPNNYINNINRTTIITAAAQDNRSECECLCCTPFIHSFIRSFVFHCANTFGVLSKCRWHFRWQELICCDIVFRFIDTNIIITARTRFDLYERQIGGTNGYSTVLLIAAHTGGYLLLLLLFIFHPKNEAITFKWHSIV